MAALDARTIVVTRDHQFFSKIRQPLADESMISLVINVAAIGEAESKFIANKANVLILDTDLSSVGTRSQLEELAKKFTLSVILTGSSSVSARPFTTATIKDFILKPESSGSLSSFVNNILVKVRPFILRQDSRFSSYPASQATSPADFKDVAVPTSKVVCVASSTGGTEAFEKVLKQMPALCPPILIVQHMPSGFTKLFAERLNNFYPMTIKEARNGDFVRAGQVLIAPADQHMSLVSDGSRLSVKCFVGQKVHAVMPAADILFESAAPILKTNAIGVVLTGMGSDGAKGLLLMHRYGAKTICQDQATSVVYGMPKAAYDLGAADFNLPVGEIGGKIMQLLR